MKIRFRSYTLGTAMLSLATLAFAPNVAAEPFNAGSYWHFKVAGLSIDGGDQEAVQLGIDFGYQFPKGFAFEAGAHRSVYDGKANNDEYTFDSIAAFVVYRTPSPIFWKVKVGYGASEINFEGSGINNVGNNLDGEGQQFGMGVGGKKFEVEWTRIFIQKVDIDMLSFNFRFGDGTR